MAATSYVRRRSARGLGDARMTVGHLLLALGFTLYVLIAMRYEERDLLARFGKSYSRWRAA